MYYLCRLYRGLRPAPLAYGNSQFSSWITYGNPLNQIKLPSFQLNKFISPFTTFYFPAMELPLFLLYLHRYIFIY